MYSAVCTAVSAWARSEEADIASDVTRVSDTVDTVTLICCLPGVSVNKLKPREKRDTSEKTGKNRAHGEAHGEGKTQPIQFTLVD